MKPSIVLLGCAVALSACDSGGDEGGGSTGMGSSTTDQVATTIPVTSVSDTTPDPTTTSASSTSEGTTSPDTDGSSGDTGSASTGAGTSSSTGTDDTSSTGNDDTTGGMPSWTVGWCNLQHPSTIETDTATATTAYARVYAEGLTDQSPGNDLDAALVVEFGYGDDGSMPPDGWTWVAASANVGWNGNDAGEPNNDEYQADLSFAATGTYDYAARVSGDGGTSWSYCDLDGLVEGGYTPEQAGHASIE